MTLALRYAARSHTGLIRAGNEDSVYAGPRLLAVADGMGGHAAGEVASAVAIAAIAPLDHDAPGSDLLAALHGSAMSANQHLRDMVAADSDLHGMGTTLVAVLFAGSRLGLLHVGDSRAYLLRDGELTQITHDHTFVQALVDEGRISEEDASTHPQRSVVTRILDGRPDVEFDLSVREARLGDRYLLCSDGLTGPVGRIETLQEALGIADPQESVDRLVQLALKGGGPDNITVVVADVVAADATTNPVVAGAAADQPQAPPPGVGDSPAARAHANRTAHDEPVAARSVPQTVRPVARRRHRRTAGVLVGVLVLLLAGAGAGWAYVRSQYYVGADDGTVAVFRGVSGSVAGVRLATVESESALPLDGLDELTRTRVEDGITASDRADALDILSRVREGYCSATFPPLPGVSPQPVATTPATTPPTTPPTTPAATSTATPAASVTPTPSASPTPRPGCP
ncbi:MAG: protein phosphatase 2C domain-containing protein [Mycobacteriales bacterium]|nr:protein phosphatase 2C domain-containing protein [Mycobacteriales bacterium]